MLSEREELIIHMKCCGDWSLRKIARAVRTNEALIRREYDHALQVLRENGGSITGGFGTQSGTK